MLSMHKNISLVYTYTITDAKEPKLRGKNPAFLLRRGKHHSICFYSASNRTIMCLLLFSCIIITKWLKALLCIGRFSCRSAVAQNKGMILPPQSYPEKFPSSTSVPLVTTSVTMAKKNPNNSERKNNKVDMGTIQRPTFCLLNI